MKTTGKYILYLVLLGILDTLIPFPILAVILITVVLKRPAWFATIVRDIYRT